MDNQTTQPGYSPAGFMREEIAQTLDTLTDMVLDYLVIDDLTPEAKEDACLCFRRVRDLLRADEAAIEEEAISEPEKEPKA